MKTLPASVPAVMSSSKLIPGWRWRARGGRDIQASRMETSHLFFTLRMIWNHSMPAHMNVGRNIKRWSFGDRHPADYMAEAVIQIGATLFQRDDLDDWMLGEMEQMARWLEKPAQLNEAAPERLIAGAP